MTDTSNFLSGFFLAGDKNDPRVNPQLRQRLALAMLARDRKYPKNLGEGIAAVGDNFANAIMQRQLEQSDLAQQDQAAKLLASPGAAPAQGTSYAPPSDDLANAPAVKAIEAATSQPQVIPPPAPAPVNVPPQAPGRGFTPVPMQPGAGEIIDPGEYNALDAADPRNRYKPAPAYLAPALERNIQDPERRGYLGQLAAKEDQTGRGVSPTGAAGPFQFTQDTGAKYGIPGNARFDPDASTLAVNRFTDDNVKTLTARLGREPTPGEMALAHQQGRGTAANMLTGTGNASDYNLSVNKVAPGTPPGAAAQKIMGYYGMPGAGVTTPGPRDAVAAALAAQQQPPSSGRPTVADYGQPLALAATPQTAPPAPSGIRAAPQQQQQPQVAQAQPQAGPQQPDFGYVMPPVDKVVPPKATDIGKIEAWAIDQKQKNQNNPYVQQDMDRIIGVEANKRAQQDKVLNEQYTAAQTQARELEMKRQEQIATQASRQAEGAKKASEAEIYKRTGQSPEQFYPEMDKQKASAEQAVKAQDAQQLARKAIRAGVVTGYGASGITASDKFAEWAFNNGMRGDRAANTEIMGAALKFGLTDAIETINGVGGKVSDSDLKIAQGIQATDPNLQMKTIKTIMDRAAEINNMKVDRYEQKVSTYLGGHPQELNYATNARPVAPPEKLKLLLDSQADPEKAATMKSHFDEVYGPGAANLEISRFKRAQSRQGK